MSTPDPTRPGARPGTSLGLAHGYTASSPDARSAVALRGWALTLVLLLVPIATYWPTTFHEYGLRDDYSNLREAREEPGKILEFCASHARPLYGLLLQATYGRTSSVENLRWLRLAGALLLGAISLATFRGLEALGWGREPSLGVALLVSLLPASQVIAAWAVGWPYAAAALLALGAFFAADGALDTRRWLRGLLGAGLLLASALIYQPSALFYAVPLAAALIAQHRQHPLQSIRWAATHLAFLAIALVSAYASMTLLYATGVFHRSERIAFEHHWVGKLGWFLGEALPNALSLFVLNDDGDRHRGLYLGCAALAGALLLLGVRLEWKRYGRQRGLLWLAALLVLPTLSFSISLLASERYATYRTLLAISAVLVCFLVASVSALTERWSVRRRRLLAAAALSLAFLSARHHAYALIATPQGNEWRLILEGARRARLDGGAHPRVFVIPSSPADLSTASIYHDEFGSLSSNSEWVPREMWKRAMHDLHPGLADVDSRYDFVSAPALISGKRFDVVVDMHRLRDFRTPD